MNETLDKFDVNVKLGSINNVIDLSVIKSIINDNFTKQKLGSVSLWKGANVLC